MRKVHLCLVSAQAVPNITPALDPAFRPEEVILLVSPDMHQQARWLGDILRTTGVMVNQRPIEDAWDIIHIRSAVLNIIAEKEDDNIALNATGGTKPMSIAAYETFRAMEKPIFYVHPEQDRVIWMYPQDRPDHDLVDRIRLSQFLQAYGATIEEHGSREGVPQRWRDLTRKLVENIRDYAGPLRKLNWAAQAAEGNLRSEDLGERHEQKLADLIELFQTEDLLRRDGNRLVFPDEPARFYVNGGWLEQHVYGVCLNLKKELGIQDIGRSIVVVRSMNNAPVRNELDVAFLADNRLYLIECKTKHFGRNTGHSGEGAGALYKLDTLTELLGGLQARGMLVSYQQLSKHDQQRAQDLRIKICSGVQLQQLGKAIRDWVQ